ncbi:hypothetical protein [Ruminiclostridium cellobioparum]|uniref:hypothetical protein n=1 Tax=Ruminiclostridium cellobioparum TaxID=29355 RepID=UPI0028A997B0|nr:hypothetical protein [Ruminiclostridium cellobioparum]
MREVYHVIFDPENGSKSKTPEFPIIIAIDGYIYETISIAAAVEVITKSSLNEEYLDYEGPETKWHLRVMAARRHSMIATMMEKESIIFDSSYGRIKENYSAKDGDPDYEDDFHSEPIKILVDNDIEFIKSLVTLGTIGVWVRDDYNYLDSKSEFDDDKIKSKGGRYVSITDGEEIVF